jgi:hypothetical protein
MGLTEHYPMAHKSLFKTSRIPAVPTGVRIEGTNTLVLRMEMSAGALIPQTFKSQTAPIVMLIAMAIHGQIVVDHGEWTCSKTSSTRIKMGWELQQRIYPLDGRMWDVWQMVRIIER